MRRHAYRIVLAVLLCLSLAVCSYAATGYRLQEKDGFVAVWDCSEDCWYQTTAVPISSLPEADRLALQTGIFCADAAELQARLEDYCS